MSNVKDMTAGKPVSLMIKFSIPLLISNTLQMMLTIVDSAIIGRMLGVSAFASIGATMSLYWLVFSGVLGINQGFGTLIAQRFGAKDSNGLHKTFITSVYLAVGFAVAIGIGLLAVNRPLMELMLTPSDLIDGSIVYLNWIWAGMPLTFGYNLCAMTLFALGDSKTPLYGMVIATVVNIVFDLILIIPFGIAGVASASLIAQAAAMLFCIRVLIKTGLFKGCGFIPDIKSVWPLLRLALPLGFRNAIIEVGALVVQRYVNGYGTEFVAGVAAAKRMYSLLMIAGGAIEAAITTFVAQNFGAKQFQRVKEGLKDGLKLSLGAAVVIMAVALPFGRQILGLLIDGDSAQVNAVLDVGVRQLDLMSLGLPFLYLLFLYRAALQGLGNAVIPMISGFIEFAFRIFSVVVLSRFIGDWGVLVSDPLGWPLAAVLLVISYFIVFKRLCKKPDMGSL